MQTFDKTCMLEKLHQLQRLDINNVYFGTTGPMLPEGAFMQPLLRFNFMLGGRRPIVLPIDGKAVAVILRQGDMYISVPHSWEAPEFTDAHEMLSLVPRGSYFRAATHAYHLTDDGRISTGGYQYHTSQPPSEILHSLCLTLCSCAVKNESRPVHNLLTALKCIALTECADSIDEPPGRRSAEVLFQQMQKWLENHFQEVISRDMLAAHFDVTPSYVSRLYRRMTGNTFAARLTKERLAYARTLLAETDLAVFQIASQCGFSSSAYFIKRFRQHYGMPPTRFRKRLLP